MRSFLRRIEHELFERFLKQLQKGRIIEDGERKEKIRVERFFAATAKGDAGGIVAGLSRLQRDAIPQNDGGKSACLSGVRISFPD